MIQSSDERERGDLPDALNGARDRRVLLQREVGPHFIIIGGVPSNDATQERFAEHDAVVDALASKSSRLGARHVRTGGGGTITNAHCSHAPDEGVTVHVAVIADQVSRRLVPRSSLSHLPGDPFGCWMSGDAEAHQPDLDARSRNGRRSWSS